MFEVFANLYSIYNILDLALWRLDTPIVWFNTQSFDPPLHRVRGVGNLGPGAAEFNSGRLSFSRCGVTLWTSLGVPPFRCLPTPTSTSSHRYKATLHDACTFVLREEGSHKLVAILTIHVDDLLVAAMPKQIKALETFLSAAFGNLTLDNAVKGFRHFGVDLTYDQKMRKITSSQLHYVNDLTLIETPKRVNKTLPCPPEIVTQYRASVSAVAWVGVTSPWALASVSYTHLTLPTNREV